MEDGGAVSARGGGRTETRTAREAVAFSRSAEVDIRPHEYILAHQSPVDEPKDECVRELICECLRCGAGEGSKGEKRP